jgi:hypothetical protein
MRRFGFKHTDTVKVPRFGVRSIAGIACGDGVRDVVWKLKTSGGLAYQRDMAFGCHLRVYAWITQSGGLRVDFHVTSQDARRQETIRLRRGPGKWDGQKAYMIGQQGHHWALRMARALGGNVQLQMDLQELLAGVDEKTLAVVESAVQLAGYPTIYEEMNPADARQIFEVVRATVAAVHGQPH